MAFHQYGAGNAVSPKIDDAKSGVYYRGGTIFGTGRHMARLAAPSLAPSLTPPTSAEAAIAVTQPRAAAKRLDALTSLRFFAAGAIVIHHLSGQFGVPANFTSNLNLGQGVTFFFILSGFILAYVYPQLDGPRARRFLVARIARIWPLQVVMLLATLPFALPLIRTWTVTQGVGITLAHFTLLHAWVPDPKYGIAFDPPSWSLSAELFFYLCFPLLIWRWRTTWHWKIVLTLLLVVGVAMLRYIPAFKSLDPPVLIYKLPVANLFEFTLGIGAMHIWRALQPRITFSRWVGTAIELSSLLLVGVVMLHTIDWATRLMRVPLIGREGFIWLGNSGFVFLPFAILIVVMALDMGWVARALQTPFLVLLGEISFSVYMVHYAILIFADAHPPLYAAYSYPMLRAVYLGAVLLTAYVTWTLIEMPSRWVILTAYDGWVAQRRGIAPRATIPAPHKHPVSLAALLRSPIFRGGIVAILVFSVVTQMLHTSAAPPLEGRVRTDKVATYSVAAANAPLPVNGPVIIRRDATGGGLMSVDGWAVDEVNHRLARAVYVSVDNQRNYAATYGYTWPDVAAFFHNPRYDRAGFRAQIPLRELAPGNHTVTLKVVGWDKGIYYESNAFDLVVQ